MFKAIIQKEKGIALILTLTIIAILTAVTMQIHHEMSQSMETATITKDRLALKEAAMSGIHVAMGILAKDRRENETDSIQEDWADSDKISLALDEIPLEGYTRKVTITDEMGKLQVNALVKYSEEPEPKPHHDHEMMWKDLLKAMFTAIESEEKIDEELKAKIKDKSSPEIITDSLIDWLDPGDEVYGQGAEYPDHYSELDPPYKPKDGPITDIDEMLLVKGILPEIFKGLGDKSLSNYVTVFGAEEDTNQKFFFPGRININTAPIEVLIGLLGIENTEVADNIVSYREEKKEGKFANDISGDNNWYQRVTGFSDIKLDGKEKLITTKSEIFQITSTASIGSSETPDTEDPKEKKKESSKEEEEESEEGEEERRSPDRGSEKKEETESVEGKEAEKGVGVTITAVIQRIEDKKSKKWQCKILKWKTD